MNTIDIWTPRYRDNVCLVATYKVLNGDNYIKFTKARHLNGMLFKITGDEIRNCPVDSNGRIPCYAIPMDKLERVE